jgi:hypothetical protein
VRHRPGKGNMQHYRACLGCGVRKRSNYNWVKCQVGLCVSLLSRIPHKT